MTTKRTFTATIKDLTGLGAFVEVPFDVEAAFGSKRPKIKAMLEGIPYRGILDRMGDSYTLLVLKEIREKLGRNFGDDVTITVVLDTKPRVVAAPADLKKAFQKEKAARAFFDSLAYTHKREYVNYILEARRAETRRDRVARVLTLLKQRKKQR